ncbi:GNAT family N-acetyltransferase [Amycolatopsis sp. SID8362]|uniref:GNAT family N-acetyltransferase n=1 Tax=Amycolatopsis sp. SID8362 TaxID=2690346 RepID=UPI001369AF08|nr:GNAT family N-acetyltransferase [Amycolatopsis sp. SID8362]NBH11987.1 GNAT family N-acetyltransferase [Amycolatopsis sp. SID8362]NED48678.1 GNAT family N-acetyltransferase [Amycolatopsis sp. SID8362]
MRELTWRPLVPADAKASADLLNAIETVDRIGENYTEEDTLQELIDPYADLERASLAALDGEAMVGYMKVRHKASADEVHRVFLDGGVHPAYRRRGIGTALLEAGVAAAKVVHARHHPALRLVVDVHKAEHIAGVPELARSRGFAPVRYFQRMEHALTRVADVVVPGVRIEGWSPSNDEDFRSVRNASYRDFWGAAPMPADQWRNKIVNQTFQPGVSFLARDGGVAMGVLVTLSWEADTAATGVRDAHFMVIGTLREHRRRGVASALLGHALRAAAEQGYDRASLNVDSADPMGASGIFAKAGFVPKQRYVRWALEV